MTRKSGVARQASKAQGGKTTVREQPTAAERELLDFIALVMLAIKEEIEDLRNAQSKSAQAFSAQLMEIGKQLPQSPAMAAIVELMQGDDLRNQRQQHVVNALRYVEDLIRERFGRDWEPNLTERATGWGEGLLAGQNLEMVRAHFHHYLLGPGTEQGKPTAKPETVAGDDVELF
ncbi:hypothetical protein V6B08_06945 [Ferrovibrio sp. MS7]|uniref:hypothetical protein n=1 Tax=Ferrovibrio plantarum TaxID=3119164 RepID=UPI001B485CFF|nr:hypothetical protein [Ferrovibrio sp.]